MTYQEGMDLFLRHKARTVTGAYYQNCCGQAQRLGDFIGHGTPIASLCDQTVMEWINQKRPTAANQISSKAEVNKAAVISSMLSFLHRNGHISANPITGITRLRLQRLPDNL